MARRLYPDGEHYYWLLAEVKRLREENEELKKTAKNVRRYLGGKV